MFGFELEIVLPPAMVMVHLSSWNTVEGEFTPPLLPTTEATEDMFTVVTCPVYAAGLALSQ